MLPGAQFMAGQWGTAGGALGTPGSIYKVDGTTGEISLFTTIAANSGAGLGDIVFDRATEQFFVSDLDTGLIYRLGLDGTILDTFDHGVAGRPNRGLSVVPDDGSEIDITNPAFNTEDPKTWGFAPPERKVYGLAMHGGRLFYAVAAGPQIWSIGINLDGTFSDDARWELDVTGLPSSNEVSNIVFDNQGRMILAQRGPQVGSYDYSVFAEPQTSSVVRYAREVPDDINTPSVWVETPDSYAIGFRPDGQNATGGIALGYAYDAKNRDFGGACGAFLWSTGDSLRDNPALATRLAAGGPAVVHGLQGNDRDLVRPQNDPPNASYFTDYDGQYDDGANQGHVGDVEIWQQCDGGYIPPYMPPPGYVPPPSFNLTLTKAATPRTCFAGDGDWFCGFTIRVKNTGSTVYWGPVNVDDWLPDDNPGATMTFAPQPYWSCGQIGTTEYDCGYPPVALFPGDSLDLYETVKLPMRGNNLCWLDNGASIDWPYGLGDDNPGDDYDFASARIPDSKCRPPQGPKTNLQLQKFAHPANCLQGRGGWDCVFYVKVTNTGPGDYNAPTEVKDTLGINVPAAVSPSPPWSCAQAGATLTCDHPAQLLHPGQYVQFRVDAVIPYALARDKQICKLANSAQITKAPGGSDLNLDPSDDQAAATATIPGEQCNPDRPRTDLSIKKEAIGCSPSGDIGPAILPITGFACAFKVTVKNEGPANFNAPILVHDTFAPAIPRPRPCSLPPGSARPRAAAMTARCPPPTCCPARRPRSLLASGSRPTPRSVTSRTASRSWDRRAVRRSTSTRPTTPAARRSIFPRPAVRPAGRSVRCAASSPTGRAARMDRCGTAAPARARDRAASCRWLAPTRTATCRRSRPAGCRRSGPTRTAMCRKSPSASHLRSGPTRTATCRKSRSASRLRWGPTPDATRPKSRCASRRRLAPIQTAISRKSRSAGCRRWGSIPTATSPKSPSARPARVAPRPAASTSRLRSARGGQPGPSRIA
jgi:hypothetical protein